MDRKTRFSRWLFGMVVLAVAECACVAAVQTAFVDTAQAQSRSRRSSGGGFFEQLFGIHPQPRFNERQREPAPADYSRAPSPRKPDPKAEPVEPTTSIVVMGDGMADWLAYGLEDAFSDSPEVAIVRESKVHSGLLRYESKSDLDWWDAAREILAKDKANYVVMMLGVSDRQNIREKDIAQEPEKKPADQKAGAADAGPDSIVAPEPPRTKKANGVVEFRSDRWEKVYSQRIDRTIAALKSKGVPVFWVGLPSIRGTKSTADAVYLNELYRARAERAGAVYIDIWDGFVDEAGKYSSYGPDYEGQKRRLRSGDGVYFTKYGARKLAHYVEREIRRYMNNRGPIALPFGPMGPVPATGPVERPLAGPVVPLTVTTGNNDQLLGGGAVAAERTDATAAKVLVKGDAISAPIGRADDFAWPVGSDANKPAADTAVTASPTKTAPAAATPAKPAQDKPASDKVAPGKPSAAAPPVAAPPKAAALSEPTKVAAPAKPAEPAIANPEPIMTPESIVDAPAAEPGAKVQAKPETRAEPMPEPKPAHNAAAKPKPVKRAEAKAHAPPRASAPRPPQRRGLPDDGLFGRNGPFGFLGR